MLLNTPRKKSTGAFTLAYDGESTDSIPYDADSAELAAAIGNLSTLAGANITAETSNCSTPEVTCAWLVTFVGVYGDAELLTADVDELGGNAADVTVTEEVMGQDTLDIDGSPVLVRTPTFQHLSRFGAVYRGWHPNAWIAVVDCFTFCVPVCSIGHTYQ